MPLPALITDVYLMIRRLSVYLSSSPFLYYLINCNISPHHCKYCMPDLYIVIIPLFYHMYIIYHCAY